MRRLAIKELPTDKPEDKSARTPYMTAGSEVRTYCENELLKALETETDASVRKKLNDTISEIAQYMSLHGTTWTSLLPVVFKCIQSSSEHFRESGLSIIALLPDLIIDQDVHFVKQIFVQLVLTSPNLV